MPAKRSVGGGGVRMMVVEAGPAQMTLSAKSEGTAAAVAVVGRHDEPADAVVHHALDEGRRAAAAVVVAALAEAAAAVRVAHVLGVGDSDETARRGCTGSA